MDLGSELRDQTHIDLGPGFRAPPPSGQFHGSLRFESSFDVNQNRLSLIPVSLFKDVLYSEDKTLILDVGCNSGELTVAFYKHLQTSMTEEEKSRKAVHILGFDLDETLIQRANETNPFPNNIAFIHLDITSDAEALQDYLKQHGCSRFHLCLCLAVTMWVHLNHGDSGLLKLLFDLSSCSQHLLLEAQPWKCYRSAARRLRKLGIQTGPPELVHNTSRFKR
uniref:RNA methyltransferase n=1 Tax=Knipowitschia caucasica TaxID=637954 RepID=A0AAV2M885_KNICA